MGPLRGSRVKQSASQPRSQRASTRPSQAQPTIARTTNTPSSTPSLGPRLVFLDPDLVASTPLRVWLSTGVSAVDHCVDAICSADASEARTESAVEGLRRLVGGLLGAKRASEARDSREKREKQRQQRLNCQLGALEAIKAPLGGVSMGDSHGIGHQLGPLGVGHGETSCVLLPAVCRFNKSVSAAAQALVVDAMLDRGGSNAGGDDGDVSAAKISSPGLTDVRVARDTISGLNPDSSNTMNSISTPTQKSIYNSNANSNLLFHDPNWKTLDFAHWKRSGCDLGALLDVFFRGLGMPRSLREVGGDGYAAIAGGGKGGLRGRELGKRELGGTNGRNWREAV